MKRVGFSWIARGSCRHPEAMTIRGGSLCPTDFPAMVGVIRHPDAGLLLFDTGYDEAFLTATQTFPERLYRWATPVRFDESGAWAAWLARHGLAAADINGVIVSHFHGDHVAGLHHLGGRPVYCSSRGLNRVHEGGRAGRVLKGFLDGLVPQDTPSRARFFEDAPEMSLPSAFAPFTHGRDILRDGSLAAVELPGHCVGHWGLAFRTSENRHVLLAGDAVWSSAAIDRCVPPPRLTTALLGDTRLYRETLSRLHRARVANPDLAILPSHCPRAVQAYGHGG